MCPTLDDGPRIEFGDLEEPTPEDDRPPMARPTPAAKKEKPPPKPRSAWFKLLWTLIVMVLILIGLISYALVVRHEPAVQLEASGPNSAAQTRLEALEGRVSELEKRIQALEERR